MRFLHVIRIFTLAFSIAWNIESRPRADMTDTFYDIQFGLRGSVGGASWAIRDVGGALTPPTLITCLRAGFAEG